MLGERQKAREPGARMSRWCRRWNLLERMQRYPELGMECSSPPHTFKKTNKKKKKTNWWGGGGVGA